MLVKAVLCLEDLLSAVKAEKSQVLFSASASIAGRRILVESDERGLFGEFFVMFGGQPVVPGRAEPETGADIHVRICTQNHADFGWFRMSEAHDLPVDGREFDLAVERDDGLFEAYPVTEIGWKCFAFRGEGIPAFAFRGRDCLFSLGPQWRRGVMSYLFWRLLRSRADAVFFHASALDIFGEGSIFVGPAGAGKSTTSLALAARGHNFLSDEIAAYIPARGELIPFRRPVGIRPGPRASAVERGLTQERAAKILRDGFARIDVDTLFPVSPPRTTPLRRVVFLRGFAAQPRLMRIEPGREELIQLQPAMSSFIDVPHSRRVFELTRMLSTAKVYRLHPGEPDATAVYLEEAFAKE